MSSPCRSWESFANAPLPVINFTSVPWPNVPLIKAMRASNAPELDFKKLKVRWHPDRFAARFGTRLAAEEKVAIMQKVTQVSAQINELGTGKG